LRFRFRLAQPADDPALRQLLRELPVAGPIRLRFEREPSYLAACLPGEQTIVAEDPDGALAAVATRGVREVYVNGEPQTVGYLGGLRVHPRHQARWLLSGGFRFLRELHADGRCAGYLTTVTSSNRLAEGVLVRAPRAGFPRYVKLAELHTFTYRVGRGARAQPSSFPADLYPADRQFFPADVPRELAYYRRGSACAALWAPSGRQVVVAGYGRLLAALRPLANLAIPLPPPGTALRLGYAAFLRAEPGDFLPLLDTLLAQARHLGLQYLVLGLCEGDPNLPQARRRRHQLYRSGLYWAGWEPPPVLDARPAFVEVALL